MKITDTPSIERLKELSAKATPGLWYHYDEVFRPQFSRRRVTEIQRDHDGKTIISWGGFDGLDPVMARKKNANAAFIVAAVNYVRAALETLTPSAGEVELDGATPDQMQRANNAVEANLVDGAPKYDSAQGYACALTAIMQTDAALASPPPQPDIEGRAREMLARECEASDASWTPLAEALRSGDFYQNDGVHVSMAIRAACQTAAPNVERLHAAIDLLNTLTGHADRDVWKPADEARSLVIAALNDGGSDAG